MLSIMADAGRTAGKMITFDEGKARFNVRVAAIILDGSRVLLHTFEGDDFWCVPGGRGELLEPAPETLRREMREELGEDVAIERLVWVMENFFEHRGRAYHELSMYFLASLAPTSPLRGRAQAWDAYEGNGVKLTFEWKDLTRLESLRLLPSFLQQGLPALPATTKHVIHYDEPVRNPR